MTTDDQGQAETSVTLSPQAVGTQTVTATLQTMEQTASYALTVSPAPLQVIANPQQRAFGPATPPLTYTYSGFVNGDTASVVSGTPTLTTTATTSSAVGAYPISVAPRNERGQIHADRSRWHTDDHASANDNYTGRLTDLGGVRGIQRH